jgi:hypothetical protein
MMKTMTNNKINTSGWRNAMKTKWTTFTGILFVALAMSLGACQETRPDRDYVQADVYDKAVFQGDWFYVRTVVDHDYESYWMGYYGTFVGDQTWSEALYTMERVTWIIDKDYIYAYRTTPVVAGAEDDAVREDFREDPVAAFRITKHFDVMRRYNQLTGEELNVVEENDTERPWYERQYMRVDWSQNLLLGYYWNSLDAYEAFGYVTRESVPFYCGDGSDGGYRVEGSCKDGMDNDHDGFCDTKGCEITYVADGVEKKRELPPDPTCVADPEASEVELAGVCKPEWLPQVRYTSQEFDSAYGTYFNKELEEEGLPEGTPYYFSFVTQEMWTPDTQWIWMEQGFGSFPVSSVKVTVRNAFLRSPEESHYEPMNVPDEMWDHFGIIRMEQEVYLGGDGSTVYEPDSPRCDPMSAEYDPTYPGCDPDNVIREDRGLVDFKNYWGARHNIWVDYKDADGNVIPVADRELRHIVYYLNPGFPKWLIPTAYEVVSSWNDEFMKSVELAKTGAITGSYDCALDLGDAMPSDAPDAFSAYNGLAQDPASTPRFTGGDCVMVLRVNSADLGDGQYDDAVGSRIIVRDTETGMIDPLRSNVDPNGEQMGDLRFKFFSVINTPGAGFSGVSLPMMDPRTGELVQSNCNITRDSYESVMSSVVISLNLYAGLCQGDDIDFHDAGLNTDYDTVCAYIRNEFGALDLPEMLSGEYIKEYFANRGKVDSPVTPIVPEALSGLPSPVTGGSSFTSILSRLSRDQVALRMEELEELMGPDARAKLMSDRLMKLKGTEFERMIYNNPESYLLMNRDGLQVPIVDPQGPVTEEMLDTFSIMRKTLEEQRFAWKRRESSMMKHHMELANPYIDYNYMQLAKEYMDKGYSARQMVIHMGQLYVRNVMLHEMGHSIGMEHNFAGSIDKNNYHDEYFSIANIDECMRQNCVPGETSPEREAANCWPCPDDVSFMDAEMTVDETMAWTNEVLRMEKKRDMLGIHKYQTSSIMDYLPEVYDDFGGLGKFDKAFPLFSYAGKIEAYAGDPRVQGSQYILDPVRDGTPLPREYWTYYLGGEHCETDAQCPYNASSGLLAGSQVDAGVTQKCVEHPFYEGLPRHCSSYYQDAQKLIDSGGTSTMSYFPVMYRFCSNNRTYDISWCNTFDAGGSYREVVYNLKEFYNNIYPWSNFRQFSRSYYGGLYWFPFEIMGKITQHFYYRYGYEPGFLSVKGPMGFEDMYFSVIDSLNFFGEILATPDVGSYQFSAEDNTYFKVSDDLGQGNLDVPLGMGKYMWSSFQDGQLGINRLERQGVHLDKLYTLLALMLREWGTSYFYDERFWFNYYDLFPNETLELIGSYILDDPYYYGARKTDTGMMIPNVYALSVCTDWRSNYWTDCNPSRVGYYFPRPWEQLGDTPTISGGSNEILRNYSVILSLALLPFFTDPQYERQMFICEKGSGYCFDICEDTDVAAGTAYYFCSDPDVTPLVKDEDFVEYTSARLHKTFIAVQVEKLRAFDVKEIDVAMNLLRKANGLQERYYELLAHQAAGTFPAEYPTPDELAGAIDRIGGELVTTESFIVNIINIQRQYGISSWLI